MYTFPKLKYTQDYGFPFQVQYTNKLYCTPGFIFSCKLK